MKVYFVNVGYGDAIVIESKKSAIVIDGGSARSENYTQPGATRLDSFLRSHQITHINLMLITHLHEDHIGGLVSVVEQFPIDEIWCNVLPQGNLRPMLDRIEPVLQPDSPASLFWQGLDSLDSILRIAQQKSIPVLEIPGDGSIYERGELTLQLFGLLHAQLLEYRTELEALQGQFDEAALLEMLRELYHSCNRTSLALLVCDGAGSVLLSGDKTRGWDILRTQYDYSACVLKAAHHGQINGLPQDLLEGANPDAVVLCSDYRHTHNCGRPEIVTMATKYLQKHERAPQVYLLGEMLWGGQYGSALFFDLPKGGGMQATIQLYQ